MYATYVSNQINRRTLLAAFGGLVATLPSTAWAQRTRRLKVGHTGITWGFKPEDAQQAIQDVASLGFHGYESFGNVLEVWEPKGGLGKLLQDAMLPLRSAYCPTNLTDATKLKEEVERMVRWGRLIKKNGGSISVIGPNGVRRAAYDFQANRAQIIASLNEIGKALDGEAGTTGVLHQHTGTCVETRDETYAIMEAVDTRYVKFGPDIGQLQKGGADPVKVVKDFQSVIRHVHLKDYAGGEHNEGYCPLGQGKVDLPAILDLLEESGNDMMIMVELDPSPKMPIPAGETARIAKAFLQKEGYAFR